MTTTQMAMDPLDYFREIFPSHRLAPRKGELRYLFNGCDCARIYEVVAARIIKKNKLPLTADLEIWESKGVVREVAMVVKMVPDPTDFRYHDCSDEAQDDEGLSGGWWDGTGE